MVGLLMLENVTYDTLQHRELALHEENRARLLDVFEYRLPELAREFGDSERLRQRLVELTGIRMTRSLYGGRL
jgi:AraC-like DNA-binding protein